MRWAYVTGLAVADKPDSQNIASVPERQNASAHEKSAGRRARISPEDRQPTTRAREARGVTTNGWASRRDLESAGLSERFTLLRLDVGGPDGFIVGPKDMLATRPRCRSTRSNWLGDRVFADGCRARDRPVKDSAPPAQRAKAVAAGRLSETEASSRTRR